MSLDPLDAPVSELPTVRNPASAAQIEALARARAQQRAARRAIGIAAATVGVLGLGVSSLGPDEPVRTRGVATSPPVHLEAVVEGPRGTHALASQGQVAVDEAVVVRVRTGGPGVLTVTDTAGDRLWPPEGQIWRVEVGEHYVGGDAPQAWRPDDAAVVGGVRATLCPAPDSPPALCSATEMRVAFE